MRKQSKVDSVDRSVQRYGDARGNCLIVCPLKSLIVCPIKNLIAILDTLRESGLTVNEKKCKFRLPKLTFFGHDLSRRGIEPSKEKIAAIQDCESPRTASEARPFMGLVQYFAKFIPDLASTDRPIQDLTREHIDFVVWGKKQQYAFDKLKSLMTKPDVLAYFKNDCQIRVVTDASPTGLGAVLTQCQNSIWRVIAYASRSLSDVERRYSQAEKRSTCYCLGSRTI